MLNLRAFLSLNASGFEAGIKRAESVADKFANKVGRGISDRLAGFLSAEAITQFGRKTVETAGRINDLSQRLEISTDALQQWEYAATQSGAKADNVASFFEKLAEAREKALSGDKGALGSFSKLGVSEGDLKTKRVEDIGLQIGNAVKEGDAQKLISSLRDVGGRGAGALVAAMKSGLAEAFANAPLMSPEEVIRLDALGDEVDTIGKRLMAGIAPVITFFGKMLLAMFDDFQKKVAGVAAFIGNFVETKSISKAWAASRAAVDEISNEQVAREKRIEEQVAAAKKRGSGGIGGNSNRTEFNGRSDAGAQSAAAQIQNSGSIGGGSINALQQIGARVRGSTEANQALAQNNRELRNATEAIRELTGQLKFKPMIDSTGGAEY